MWKCVKPRVSTFKKRKDIRPKDVTAALEAYLRSDSPELAQTLVWILNDQPNMFTYSDIREAIVQGYLDESWIERWMQDYSQKVDEYIAPFWQSAIEAGAERVKLRNGSFVFDGSAPEIKEFIDNHSAQFVTNVTHSQTMAMRDMIRRAAMTEDFTVDQLSRAIRPTIGLTRQQSNTLLSYYNDLRMDGYTEEEALRKQIKRAGQMHRYRAETIADYELTQAYNRGNDLGTRQMINQGLLVPQVKVWSTDATASVCDVCAVLEGTVVGIDDDFRIPSHLANSSLLALKFDKMFHQDLPPIHPHCHCCVEYQDDPDYIRNQTGLSFTLDELKGMTDDDFDRIIIEDEYDDVQSYYDIPGATIDASTAYNFTNGNVRQTNLILSGDPTKIAQGVNEVLNDEKYGLKDSLWNGKVKVESIDEMGKAIGRMGWDRIMVIRDDSIGSFKTYIHENLHSRSILYCNPQTYKKHGVLEEGTVEYLAQEICKVNSIPFREAYKENVSALKRLRQITCHEMPEYDFVKNLFDMDADQRYNFVELLIGNYKKQRSSIRYTVQNDLDKIIEIFRPS